jgi:MoaD family protein
MKEKISNMKITIKLLKPFSNAVGENELNLDFNGNTLKDLINILIGKYPQLKKELYEKNDQLTDYICIFVNDKPIAALKEMNTELKNNDEILFFMPVSGG